ncbi:MAG: hypothetical protein V6Z82_06355 [Flavobacteriales bacterium]
MGVIASQHHVGRYQKGDNGRNGGQDTAVGKTANDSADPRADNNRRP